MQKEIFILCKKAFHIQRNTFSLILPLVLRLTSLICPKAKPQWFRE